MNIANKRRGTGGAGVMGAAPLVSLPVLWSGEVVLEGAERRDCIEEAESSKLIDISSDSEVWDPSRCAE